MDGVDAPQIANARWEIARGLECAQHERYDEALRHLTRARSDLPEAPSTILAGLDAVIQGHKRYCEAEHALHAASEHFAAASAQQRMRLHELERALASSTPEQRPASPPEGPDQDGAAGGEDLPALSITCFGRFQVRQAGKALHLCQNRNGQTILRYLAVQPDHRAPIDTLMEALWPEEAPEVGRHKLYVASSALRRALNGEHVRHKGSGYLLCEGGAYALNPGAHIRIDVDDFLALYRAGRQAETAVRVERFEAACRLYAGCMLPDDQYADWAAVRREQLARVFLSMFAVLASHYLAAGRYERAAECARRMLEDDRCDEAAVRLLMRAYVGDGRRSEALRQYRLCQRALSEELGVPPMPETTELYRAILDGESLPSMAPGEREQEIAVGAGRPGTEIELRR